MKIHRVERPPFFRKTDKRSCRLFEGRRDIAIPPFGGRGIRVTITHLSKEYSRGIRTIVTHEERKPDNNI